MRRIVYVIGNSKGSISALMVFFLFVSLGLLAVVIDIGHLHAVKNELANAADAAALAGARALYPMPYGETITGKVIADCQGARDRALATIQANFADKERILQVGGNDIQIGKYDISKPPSKDNFVPGCSEDANAVLVRTLKTDAFNNPVTMGFAKFLYGDNVSVWAEAIAYSGYAATLAPGCALPVGIPHCSDNDPTTCPYEISFINDNTDTSAWHTFNIEHANANCLKYIINNCVLACPGDPPKEAIDLTTCPNPSDVYVNNGEINSALQATYDKFVEMKTYDEGLGKDVWLTQILMLSCSESNPCGDAPGSIDNWRAVQTLQIRAVKCFKVTMVGAAGRDALDPNDPKFAGIKGCIVDDDDCTVVAPPEGPGPKSVIPVLVWTDSNTASQ